MPRRPLEQPSKPRAWTRDQTRQHKLAIAQLWFAGESDPRAIARQIERAIGEHISVGRAARLLNEVRNEQLALDVETLRAKKLQQVKRLHRDANAARAAGKMNVVVQIERLLADITGTLAPLQLDVAVTRQVDVLREVMGGMDDDELAALVEEEREAEEARRRLLAERSAIPVEAEAVVDEPADAAERGG